MLKRLPKPAVKRLPLNTKGTDLIVGDIHGMFDLVLRAMDKMNFDQSCDRLISVGDMIDRGPGSHRTAKFLSCSFVEAVLGNHEGMLLEAYVHGGEKTIRWSAGICAGAGGVKVGHWIG